MTITAKLERVIKTSNITSLDETISVPSEVAIFADGSAEARHPEYGDHRYETIDQLCSAYQIDRNELEAR